MIRFGILSMCTVSMLIAKEYSIKELVELAEKNYGRLKEIRAMVQSAVYLAKQARVWDNPIFEFSLGRKQAEGTSGLTHSVEAEWPILFPSKRAVQQKILETTAKAFRLTYQEQKVFLRFEVKRLASFYRILSDRIAHLQERVKRFRLIRTYIYSRPFYSAIQRTDRNIVINRIYHEEDELLRLKQLQNRIFLKLNFYIRLKDDPKTLYAISAVKKLRR